MKSKNGVGMVELANVLIFCHGSFLGDWGSKLFGQKR
jgi:hypothetical protein